MTPSSFKVFMVFDGEISDATLQLSYTPKKVIRMCIHSLHAS